MAWRPRVLIEDGSVRASQDGYSVETAPLDKMAFDSRFASIGLPMSGKAVVPNRAPGKASPGNLVVQFGRTFLSPPMFLFGWQVGTRASELFMPKVLFFNDLPGPQQDQRTVTVEARVSVRNVLFRNFRISERTTVWWKTLV